jgi:hypothetical protein
MMHIYIKLLNMNYQKIYNQLIERAVVLKQERIQMRKNGFYFETHHIVPVCMGGEGSLKDISHDNLVQLTAREHFICHRLLTKIYPKNRKLASAFWRMCTQKSKIQNRYIPTSREYEEARLHCKSIPISDETRLKMSTKQKGRVVSEKTKQKLRIANLGKKQSEESKQKKSQKLKGKVPWNKGITYNVDQKKPMSKLNTLAGKSRVPFSTETKRKMSVAKQGSVPWNKGIARPKLRCIYCDKEGGDGNMQRWHFDNCKYKP